MPHETPEELTPNPGDRFLETVVALKNGAVLHEIGERLQTMISAVRSTDRPGSITIALKVSPVSGSGEVVTVEASIKENTPRPSLGKTVFFTTDEGTLLRDNPRQLALKIGE